MVQLKFKVLTHIGQMVDGALLPKGIYTTGRPNLYNSNETIESLIQRGKEMKNMVSNELLNEAYFTNLAQCELTDYYLIDKQTINVLENALQCYFHDANTNLSERKDLGDMEKSNYQWAMEKSREVMKGLDLL